jgi:4,5-dihydroxyphthalate decarboxylase
MANLKLTLACWDYDRTRPLMDGRVKADGIDLDIQVLRPQQIFSRMLEDRAFHASELSLASFATLKARGACPFVAIPVALSKIFRHSCIYVRTDAGIAAAHDLRGKRVGTMQYGATAVVFMKGLMRDEYGVAAKDMHWFVGGLRTPAERPLIPLELSSEISLEFVHEGQTLEQMLAAGELDALFSVYIPSLFLEGSPRIARLFHDFKAAEQDYYRRTRIFPIMHIVVVREDVYRDNPWVADSLYRAFSAARDLAVNGLYDTDALRVSLPWLLDHVEENWRVFGHDFWSYGVEPNRATFEAIGRYVHEQGLAPRSVTANELFTARMF